MNFIKHMKEQIAKSGTNKKEIIFFSKDTVKRVRFLQELDAGFEIDFHNDYNAHIYQPCLDPENHEECPCCQDGVNIQEQYVWSVWDYDTSSVKIILQKATGISPIPALIEMYEEYGTLMDRDYKIKKIGQGTGGSFSVTPLDKERFKNSKAKPFTRKQVDEILKKAYIEDSESDTDDEEEEEVKPKKSSKKAAKKRKEPTIEDKLNELTLKELKSVAVELGMSKKEMKLFDDEEDLISELVDNFELEDIEDVYNDLFNDEEEEDE